LWPEEDGIYKGNGETRRTSNDSGNLFILFYGNSYGIQYRHEETGVKRCGHKIGLRYVIDHDLDGAFVVNYENKLMNVIKTVYGG
jgi:hypothetical protein